MSLWFVSTCTNDKGRCTKYVLLTMQPALSFQNSWSVDSVHGLLDAIPLNSMSVCLQTTFNHSVSCVWDPGFYGEDSIIQFTVR